MKKHTQRPWRRPAAAAGVAALSLSAAGLFVSPAQAAPETVKDASFSWSVNEESGGGAFFGGCNFLHAGKAGDNGGSKVWDTTFANANYKTKVGNVTVTKPDASKKQVQPTWADKCLDAAGSRVGTGKGSSTHNQVNFNNGTGTVDVAAGTAELSWDGDFTIVYYGGMTYWSISDPELTVKSDGTGELTGTASGYGADMFDPSKWVTLPETEIQLATFSGAKLSADGKVEIKADYAGVKVDGDDSGTFNPQNREKEGWGAFPQSWVDFNLLTGQSAYWYTSGGAVDPKKSAAPITLGYTVKDDGKPDPEPSPEPTPKPTPEPNPIPTPGDDDVKVEVEVPKKDDPAPEPGTFKWELKSGEASLGKAKVNAAGGFSAQGQLPEVTVTDSRSNSKGWELNGKAGEFINEKSKFSASALGWHPSVSGDSAVKAGAEVAAGQVGLAEARSLATSTAASKATIEAELNLLAPANTPAGDYQSLLTITAVQK